MNNSLVNKKAMDFALLSIDLYKKLLHQNEYILSKQFIRSATSIGANIQEALSGYSKKDFAYKMSISNKEARETLYWLELLEYGKFITYDYSELKERSHELIKILHSIVRTSKVNIKKPK